MRALRWLPWGSLLVSVIMPASGSVLYTLTGVTAGFFHVPVFVCVYGTYFYHSTNANISRCFSVVCQCQLPRCRVHPTSQLRSGAWLHFGCNRCSDLDQR